MAPESLKQRCEQALEAAFAELEKYVAASGDWTPVPVQPTRSNAPAVVRDVQVHKKQVKRGADTLRAQASLSTPIDLQDAAAVLQLAEQRVLWDGLVDRASLIQAIDCRTSLIKTDYKLGWPAQPRDTITVGKLWADRKTLIYLATSIPNVSAEDPPFLRPAPPYVRAHLHVFAIILETLENQSQQISIFQRWNLRGTIFSRPPTELQDLLSTFIDHVSKTANTLPLMQEVSPSLDISILSATSSDDTFTLEVTTVDSTTDGAPSEAVYKSEASLSLPSVHGWTINLTQTPPSLMVTPQIQSAEGKTRLTLALAISGRVPTDSVGKVKVTVKRLPGGKIIRYNEQVLPVNVNSKEKTTEQFLVTDLLQNSKGRQLSPPETQAELQGSVNGKDSNAQLAQQTAISTTIRRSYTYFASLLQEPEAKWRNVTETKGVALSQLNSIDPTVTIFRAVATFVGVGVWDLFATITSPGARLIWERNVESVQLVDDVNDLSALWYLKYKAVWPAWARDSVQIRTTYKAPTSVHIFSFSVDDERLFPKVPLLGPNTIRTATVIQGWALEALSPTTTQVTLIEQTNNRGWSNKSWTYNQMLAIVSSVGDFSIKHGAPPVLSRLSGAKVLSSTYNHEKGSLKMEYKATSNHELLYSENAQQQNYDSQIECELRCDTDTWCSSLDIVTDPPPAKVSCLLRHKLSSSGSGCWITIEHNAKHTVAPILLLVRKGAASRPKGSVFINGARIRVDAEGMKETELKSLSTQRRLKASPMPLDQLSRPTISSRSSTINGSAPPTPTEATSGLAEKLYNSVARVSLPTVNTTTELPPICQALDVLAILQQFYAHQGPELIPAAPEWTKVSDKDGLVRKKIVTSVAELSPVFRGDKIAEGVTAEDVVAVLNVPSLRPAWDENIASCQTEASFGSGARIISTTSKTSFFSMKSRTNAIAQVQAYVKVPSSSASNSTTSVYLFAGAGCQYEPITKGNPTNQQTLLEGWILETLDPYVHADCALPSTRVSYFTCSDGSASAGLSSLFAQNPVKYINAVTRLAKNLSLPYLQSPSPFLQIEGPLSSDAAENFRWIVGRSSTKAESLFLSAEFQAGRNKHSTLVLVSPVKSDAQEKVEKAHSRSVSTPFKKITSPSLRSASSFAALPKSSLSVVQASPRLEDTETATFSGRSSPKHDALGRTSSFNGGADFSVGQRQIVANELIFCELVVSYELFTQGYEVNAFSAFTRQQEVILDQPSSLSDLPIRLSVFELPSNWPSNLVSGAQKQRQHLLRLSVSIQTSDRPLWLSRLQRESAAISVSITPLANVTDDSGIQSAWSSTAKVLFNGSQVQVLGDRESKAALSKHEADDWALHSATISRVPTPPGTTVEATLSPTLMKPLATSSTAASILSSANSLAPLSPDAATSESPMALSNGDGLNIATGSAPSLSESSKLRAKAGSFSQMLSEYSAPIADAVRMDADFRNGSYSLRFLIICSIIAFLLGSFFRSILSPADYIMEVNSTKGGVGLLEALEPGRKWRHARRLFELRFPWTNNDLTVALVRRRPN